MASKMNKKYSAEITGILDIREDGIFVEVEDIEGAINLADFIADFNSKDIKIAVGYKQEV